MTPPLFDALESAAEVGDLPAVLLVGRPRERTLLGAARIAARLAGAPRPATPADAAGFFGLDREAEVVVQRAQAQAQARVCVHCAYAQCGALLLDAAPPAAPTALHQAALVELAKEAAGQRQLAMDIDMHGHGRRVVVFHAVDRLPRHLQHALRRIVEATTAVALFVLTAEQVGGVDAPLRSRALAVSCGAQPRVTPDAATVKQATALLDPRGDSTAAKRRARAAAERALLASCGASAAAAADAVARLAEAALLLCGDEDKGEAAGRVVAAAADADHALRAHPGCDPEWVLRALLVALRGRG